MKIFSKMIWNFVKTASRLRSRRVRRQPDTIFLLISVCFIYCAKIKSKRRHTALLIYSQFSTESTGYYAKSPSNSRLDKGSKIPSTSSSSYRLNARGRTSVSHHQRRSVSTSRFALPQAVLTRRRPFAEPDRSSSDRRTRARGGHETRSQGARARLRRGAWRCAWALEGGEIGLFHKYSLKWALYNTKERKASTTQSWHSTADFTNVFHKIFIQNHLQQTVHLRLILAI